MSPSLTTVRLGSKGLRYQWFAATLADNGQHKRNLDFIEHMKKGVFLNG
jgi:hypothetical protein